MKNLLFLICFLFVQTVSASTKEVDKLLEKSQGYYNINIDSVYIILQKAHRIAISNNDLDGELKVDCHIINYASYKQDFELGDKFFKEGFEKATKTGNKPQQIWELPL